MWVYEAAPPSKAEGAGTVVVPGLLGPQRQLVDENSARQWRREADLWDLLLLSHNNTSEPG